MSPVSRGRRRKPSSRKARRRDPVAEEDRLAGDLVAAFRDAASETDPLVVEMMVSDVMGMVWRETSPGDDPEGPVLDLTAAVGRRRDPAALAFLRGLAAVGPSDPVREAAADAADAVTARGVPDPPWAAKIGKPAVRECWRMADVYGDMLSLVCVFAYGRRRHALVALLDLGDGTPWAKDLLVLDQPGAILRQMRATVAGEAPLASLTRVDPAEARCLLEAALAGAEAAWHPDVPGTYAQNRALALARCGALPESAVSAARAEPATVSDAEREAVVSGFLASPEAAGLPAGDAARYCARLVVEFGADADSGRPLRVSPGKIERFLHEWVPGKAVLDEDDRAAMPAVIAAWARWAGGRSGLPPEAVAEVIAVADQCASHFLAAYDDQGGAGPGGSYVAGLELTGDLSQAEDAVDRRIFAMPYIGTRIGDEDYPRLDPADPDERRLLIEGEHPEYHPMLADATSDREIDGVNPRLHVAMHEVVANQLWDDDPPEAWQAARRLRDRGLERHEILHRLMNVAVEQLHGALTSGTAADSAAYARALDRIAPDRKGRRSAAGRGLRVVGEAAADATVVLKVSLRGAKPPIWRRLRVPGRMTLDTLHDVLQVAFGWTDSHLHLFESGGRQYSDPSHELGWGDTGDESRVRLSDVVGAPGDRLRYEYDFGDSWEHDIVVEDLLPADGATVAVCVGGRRAGPPEDCGGVWGYAELCAVLADPRHPDHGERTAWVGGRLDPAHFDPQEINAILRRLPVAHS